MDGIKIETEQSPQAEPTKTRRVRFPLIRLILAGALMGALLSTGGCKQQQQMQQQIEAMDARLAESQKRVTALESELKKTSFEIQQMKALVTKLGTVVVDLQKIEEDRRAAAEAAKSAAAKKAPRKPAPKARAKR